jgi:hypothetical protein
VMRAYLYSFSLVTRVSPFCPWTYGNCVKCGKMVYVFGNEMEACLRFVMGAILKLEQSGTVSVTYARQVKLHPPLVLGECPYAPRYAPFLIQPNQRSVL